VPLILIAVSVTLKRPDIVDMLSDISLEALPGSPEDMKVAINIEKQRWKKVIELSGATSE